MLHLRLITPADRTADVVRLIERTVGTTHLAVVPGAALNPPGDLVMCDVAREAGDELIGGLRALGIDEVVNAQNVRMGQPSSLEGFATKAFQGGRIEANLRRKEFESDDFPKQTIVRLPYDAHATVAEDLLEQVPPASHALSRCQGRDAARGGVQTTIRRRLHCRLRSSNIRP